MQFAQLFDQVDTDNAAETIDFDQWAGSWINSNPDTTGIARLVISEVDHRFYLEVYGVGSNGLIRWGTKPIKTLAADPASRKGAGFTCSYDFGFVETRLQAMIVKGLIVLAQFHLFNDESGRTDFFVREYFALEHNRH